MLEKWRVKGILIFSNLTFAAIVLAVAGAFLLSVYRMHNALTEIADNTVPSVLTLSEINVETNALMVKMGSHVLATTPAETLAIDAEITPLMKQIDGQFAKYAPLISDEHDRTLFEEAKANWAKLTSALVDLRRESIAVHTDEATSIYNQRAVPAMQGVVKAIQSDLDYNTKLMEDQKQHSATISYVSQFSAIAAIIGGAAIAGFLIVLSVRRIIKPLGDLTDGLQRMAQGDLEFRIAGADKPDEIGEIASAVDAIKVNAARKVEKEAASQKRIVDGLGQGQDALANGDLTFQITEPFEGEYDRLRQSFNASLVELERSMTQVARSAQSVSDGSGEIRGASEDLSRRTEQQAAALEETTAAMNQVTDMVGETARSADEARAAVNVAHKDATEGSSVVQKAVLAMDAIEKSSQEINNIINVIDGISFQTNLLALNAGVEAARAGDAGRGFAVVANEVRALAQRSAEAATDIKGLITTSSKQVVEGVTLVGETGKMLDRIANKISDINALVDTIATSAQHQSTNLQQVNAAVSDMDKMTQQNAAMVEESTAAARNLASQADELSDLVKKFRLKSVQSSATPKPAPAPRAQATKAKPLKSVPRPSHGNLALKIDHDPDDWAEF